MGNMILLDGLLQKDLKRGDIFIVKMFGRPAFCRVNKEDVVVLRETPSDESNTFWTVEGCPMSDLLPKVPSEVDNGKD